jgi:2-aminoethylphosphonate transport system substrate-binding protein
MARNADRPSLLALALAALVAALLLPPRPARAAGEVTFYATDGLEAFYRAVLPGFEEQSGFKVALVMDGAGALVERLRGEKASPKADVVALRPPFTQDAVRDGLTAPYRSIADGALPADRKDAAGEWTAFADDYQSFIFNPKLARAPDTFEDLLKPEYKGKFSYSNPLTAADGMAMIVLLEKFWGEKKTFDYLEMLEQSIKFHTRSTSYLDVLVGRGEITLANGNLQTDMDDKAHGGMVIEPRFLRPAGAPKPVTFYFPNTVSLVRGGPNPEGGKALIEYLLSKPVQTRLVEFFGLPARNDIGGNAQALAAALKDVEIVQIDWNHVLGKQKEWQERWRSQVIDNAQKPLELVKPKS